MKDVNIKSFRFLLFLVAALVTIFLSQRAALGEQTKNEVTSVQLALGHQMPADVKFCRGNVLMRYFTGGDLDSSFEVLDKAGHEIFSRAPVDDVPDAIRLLIRDVTLSKNGIAIVSVQLWNKQGTATAALMEYDISSGKVTRMVQTWPVVIVALSADDDDSIWGLGLNVEKRNARNEDYNVVYKYSIEGTLLGSFFNCSQFDDAPWSPGDSSSPQLTVQGKRIVCWMPAVNQIFEWKQDGQLSRKIQILGEPTRGKGEQLAVLQGGGIVFFQGTQEVSLLRYLDQKTSQVDRSSVASSNKKFHPAIRLAGSDGEYLVSKEHGLYKFAAQNHRTNMTNPVP
jgi:hypothetical protein